MKRYSVRMSKRLLYGTPIIMVSVKQNLISYVGLIEALEVFTGLIMHADSKAEDKIRCKLLCVS